MCAQPRTHVGDRSTVRKKYMYCMYCMYCHVQACLCLEWGVTMTTCGAVLWPCHGMALKPAQPSLAKTNRRTPNVEFIVRRQFPPHDGSFSPHWLPKVPKVGQTCLPSDPPFQQGGPPSHPLSPNPAPGPMKYFRQRMWGTFAMVQSMLLDPVQPVARPQHCRHATPAPRGGSTPRHRHGLVNHS